MVRGVAPVVVLLATLSGACGVLLSTKVARPPAIHEFSSPLRLHDEELTLHLASPATPLAPSAPLILYASGDGGWFGAAVGMFRTIAGSRLSTVGISTKAFMRIEHRWSKPLTVAHVTEGYQQIIDAARAQLRLPPDAPVVLTGWSRGASLGVLVASDGKTDARVVGVVAVGLVADEDLDIEGDDDDPVSESDARRPLPTATRASDRLRCTASLATRTSTVSGHPGVRGWVSAWRPVPGRCSGRTRR